MTDRARGPADGEFAHVDADGRPADSAGQAWSGKTIPTHGFAGDTGEAQPGLVAALRALQGGPAPETEAAAMRRIAGARWLVPVVAVATEVTESDGLVSDTRSDMATVTLTSPDGSRALPMFSSLASLAEWDPAARPVAVPAASAAQAAVSEGCDVLVVDVASAHAVVLRSSMLWALAQQREWRPSHLDTHVATAVGRACAEEPDVQGHRLEAGAPAGGGVLRVVLGLRTGLGADDVSAIATRIGERIASDGETRARIDALTFALEAAD
ncbi:MAG: SseB family protein [Intrasporangium sp.]|uniref:SseB family protein n=1 Tax=Intrasporangium sp. TaxID=1925024 RepID=UPI003F7DA074